MFGFDATASPKWQMVPRGWERTIVVRGAGALIPELTPNDIARVTYRRVGAEHHLTLKGLKAGKGFVRFVPNAGFAGPVPNSDILEISVKTEVKINTAFHYVKDNAGHKTNRNMGDLNALIRGVNRLLDTQANVRMYRKSARTITVPQNLGATVRFSSHLAGVAAAEHEWDDVTAFADAAADFNVFFVWQYEQDATPAVNNTRAGTLAAEKNCLMQDTITGSTHAETLAHETIHLRGIGPHSGTATHLIASGAVRTGQLISRAQANIINPSGT
ncbi:hypothetical protein Q669_12400 [Labrenzia sp. C1B10]|jgi:hypothetical protein|nr:hypothetical protein Q669_12400 [Labrenzia sp. C1B10]ERS07864.1 hypothetical protein Q675_21030 [Labrenzia sp. C1B70]